MNMIFHPLYEKMVHVYNLDVCLRSINIKNNKKNNMNSYRKLQNYFV